MDHFENSTRLTLGVFDRTVDIACRSPAALKLLGLNYELLRLDGADRCDLQYRVSPGTGASDYQITRLGQLPLQAADDGDFLFLFEKDLTIEIERLRGDLYFVHAAALEREGAAVLLVAPSGTGKSTTAWGLLHHDYRYLSDELASVELASMRVLPYPRALCLKSEPPGPYPLPSETLRTSQTLHVPARRLPHGEPRRAVPLATIYFLEYRPDRKTPEIAPISKAEATARIFAQALNPLAHRDDGLSAAAAIAERVDCYALRAGDLGSTCHLVSRSVPGEPNTTTLSDLRDRRRGTAQAASYVPDFRGVATESLDF